MGDMKMGKLFFKERAIVVPGDKLASGMDYLPAGGAYRKEEDILSSVIGLLNINGRVLKVIPMKGRYLQKPGDMVIGKIADMTASAWFVNIGGSNDGLLAVRDVPEYVETGEDLSQYYNYGDHIVAKVVAINKSNFNLSLKNQGGRKLSGGRIIKVDSAKVPRIIGKQGSMIGLIKEKTGCRLIVGQNGLVWLQGMPENEFLAVEAIELIVKKSHFQGLTDIVEEFLNKKAKNLDVKSFNNQDDNQESKEYSREDRRSDSYDRPRPTRGYDRDRPRPTRGYDRDRPRPTRGYDRDRPRGNSRYESRGGRR
jgi:exosome complex component RRP4